ncbi:MAG TPA: hypothetical protein VF307_03635 [Candidatus Nanopelagicaceae bacterium]
MKLLKRFFDEVRAGYDRAWLFSLQILVQMRSKARNLLASKFPRKFLSDERGDVPGWVLVVLMTTGLVTAIWTIAAPRLSAILRNSLDSMNGIR